MKSSNDPIVVRSLSKCFGKKQVLNRIKFRIQPGEIVALLGPNGAGKSTLFKLLIGNLLPSTGDILVHGVTSSKLGATEFERIGFVAEGQPLPTGLKLGEYLQGLRPFYHHWDVELEKFLLNEFKLDPRTALKALSRGEAMKAKLVSSLSYRPELLLLDEPLAGLDPVIRNQVLSTIIDMASDDRPPTILMSTHDVDEIEHIASRCLFLISGKIVLDGSPDELAGEKLLEPLTQTQSTPSLTDIFQFIAK